MRHLTALAVVSVAVLAIVGCEERTNMRELPDRQGHAYLTASAERNQHATGLFVRDNEQVYNVQANDNLKKMVVKFGESESWYIRRNDLQSEVLKPGQALIVPKKAAAGK